jgi:type IV pilus assembly protein PilO
VGVAVNVTSRISAIWQQNKSWPCLLLTLLLLCVVLIIVNQNLIAPGVDSLEREYIGLQERSRQSRMMKAAADTPSAFYRRGVNDLGKFHDLIPQLSDFTDLVAELFRLAEKSNLRITQVNYQPKVLKGDDLLQYGLAFSVSGSYAELKKFIALIESSRWLLAIEGISLRSDVRSGSSVSLQLQLATYFKAGVA